MTQSTRYLTAAISFISLAVSSIFPGLPVLRGLSMRVSGTETGFYRLSLTRFSDLCRGGADYSFVGSGIHLVGMCSYVDVFFSAFQFLFWFSAGLFALSIFNILLSKEDK